eukprot:37932-Eustigmatos_ZCMA.PRE.1
MVRECIVAVDVLAQHVVLLTYSKYSAQKQSIIIHRAGRAVAGQAHTRSRAVPSLSTGTSAVSTSLYWAVADTPGVLPVFNVILWAEHIVESYESPATFVQANAGT